jgi:hypothetical protein
MSSERSGERSIRQRGIGGIRATKVRFFEWDETAMAKAKLAVWKNPA